jgi:ankyrin repeat protein
MRYIISVSPEESTHMVRSPLRVAIDNADLDIFRLLLSRGTDPNAPLADQSENDTILAVAVRNMHNTMVKELLDHGADPTLGDSTAVVAAAAVDNAAGMLMLIKHGVNIHVQEGVPGKALHTAARHMKLDMVKFLLENGVNVNAFGGRYGYELPHRNFDSLSNIVQECPHVSRRGLQLQQRKISDG